MQQDFWLCTFGRFVRCIPYSYKPLGRARIKAAGRVLQHSNFKKPQIQSLYSTCSAYGDASATEFSPPHRNPSALLRRSPDTNTIPIRITAEHTLRDYSPPSIIRTSPTVPVLHDSYGLRLRVRPQSGGQSQSHLCGQWGLSMRRGL